MGVVTRDEYQRICERLAREAAVFAARMAADEEPADDPDALREHWIDVFLDEHLPDMAAVHAEWKALHAHTQKTIGGTP